MIRADGQPIVTQGFASFTLWADDERWIPRQRDFRESVVARYACDTCGAKPGELCTRKTLAGPMVRRLPHFGRSESKGASVFAWR